MSAAGSTEPPSKDQREFSAALEVSTGAWFPGGKLSLSFKRNWDRRTRSFIGRTLEYADADEGQLADRVATDEQFADLVAVAGQKAVSISDEPMRNGLARLVAAAFKGDAKVDTVAFLIDLVAQLDPIQLRALRSVEKRQIVVKSTGLLWNPSVMAADVAQDVGAEVGVTRAALTRLGSVGLLQEEPSRADRRDRGRARPSPSPGMGEERGWRATALGRQFLILCGEVEADPE